MAKFRYFIYILLSLCLHFGAVQDISAQTVAASDRLYIPEMAAWRGNIAYMPIHIDNVHDVTALQFNVGVPKQMTVPQNAFRLSSRATDHVVQSRLMRSDDERNWYLVMVYSPTNAPFVGRTGKVLDMRFTLANSVTEGSHFTPLLEDCVMSDDKRQNVLQESSTGDIIVQNGPDLITSAVTFTEQSLMPDSMLNVSWTVKNQGDDPIEAGWTEEISLIESTASTDRYEGYITRFVGQVKYDGRLEGHATVSRQATFQIPSLIGIDGKCRVLVRLVPYAESNERPEARVNNTTVSQQTLTMGKRIGLTLSQPAVQEGATPRVTATLNRSGRWDKEQSFRIKVTGDARVTAPATIVLPAGQSAARFDLTVANNDKLDELGLVAHIEVSDASKSGYETVQADLTVEDDEKPSMTLKATPAVVNEGDKLTLQLSVERAPLEDTTLRLTCDHATRFEFPAEVTLPAGQTTLSIEVTAKDDALPAMTETVAFSLSANAFAPAEALVIIYDNDVPDITLTLTPTTLSEGDGPVAMMGVLRRTSNIDKDVTIRLSDDSPTHDIDYGQFASIRMNRGTEEVQFAIGVRDNQMVDGDRDVTITAAVYIQSCSCTASGERGGTVTQKVHIIDNDGAALGLTSNVSTIHEGGELTLTLRRNALLDRALTVHIGMEEGSERFEYPASVTIPAGKTEVNFTVKSLANDVNGDTFSAMLTAQADGYAKGMVWITVSDRTLPDVMITGIRTDREEAVVGDSTSLTLTLTNKGTYGLKEGVGVNVYVDYGRVAQLTLPTPLAIGESATLTCRLALPGQTGQHRIHAVANEGREMAEVQYGNNTSQAVSVRCVSPFSVTIRSDKQLYRQGEEVRITGRTQGSRTAGQEVEVYVICEGVRRVIATKTQADGTFEASFWPEGGLTGHFVLGACYPGEGLREEMYAFDCYGLRISSAYSTREMAEGETYTGSFTLTNPGLRQQQGLKIVAEGEEAGNCTFDFRHKTTMAGGETIEVSYTIKANQRTEGDDWQTLPLTITTQEGCTQQHTLYYYVHPQHAALQASTTSIRTTMCISEVREYPITLTNVGKAPTGTISLQLPACIRSSTPTTMPALAPGESTTLMLAFVPTSDMTLNVPVYGQMGVNCEGGEGLSIAYHVTPVSDRNGTLALDLVDEFTAYTEEAPHVSGASVRVLNPATQAVVAEGTTAEDGTFRASIPEGLYHLSITAANHDGYYASIVLDPGRTTAMEVFLPYQAITYTWEVEETEVEDSYVVETVVKYDTRVPKPILVTTLPDEAPEVGTVFPIVVTNKGFINAKTVEMRVECSEDYAVELMGDNVLETLAPQQSYVFYAMLKEAATEADEPQKVKGRRLNGERGQCYQIHTKTEYLYDCLKSERVENCEAYKLYGDCREEAQSIVNAASSGGSGGGGGYGGGYGGGFSTNVGYRPGKITGMPPSYYVALQNSKNMDIAIKACEKLRGKDKYEVNPDAPYLDEYALLHPVATPAQYAEDDDVKEEDVVFAEDGEEPKYVFKLIPAASGNKPLEMKGVVCDGKSRLKIVLDLKESILPKNYKDRKYRWELTMPKNPFWEKEDERPIEVMGSLENENRLLGAIFEAPDSFPEFKKRTELFDNYTTSVYAQLYDGDETCADAVEIQLYRVPIVMVHGLNSDPGTWDSMKRFLMGESNGKFNDWDNVTKDRYYKDFQFVCADYAETHNESFDTNKEVVGEAMNELFLKMYDHRIFASSVDVIGHSMGGLLTKLYLKNHPEEKPLFHKIITINTPHGGSQLGQLLLDKHLQAFIKEKDNIEDSYYNTRRCLRGVAKAFYPKNYDKNPDALYEGAVANLRVKGEKMWVLNDNSITSSIPCHAIVTEVDLKGKDITEATLLKSNRFITFITGHKCEGALTISDLGDYEDAIDLLNDLYNDEPSDLVVPISSQFGGLIKGQGAWWEKGGIGWGNDYLDGGHCHVYSLQWGGVHQQVRKALKAPSDNNVIFADGFGIVEDSLYYSLDKARWHKESNECSNEYISAPQKARRKLASKPFLIDYNGYEVGDTVVNIRLTSSVGELKRSGIACFYNDMTVFINDSVGARVVLPPKAEGELEVSIEGMTPDGVWYHQLDTLRFNTFNCAIKELAFTNDTITLFGDREMTPRMRCLWEDGRVTDCKEAVYTITDPTLATLRDGRLVGLKRGETYITGSYRGTSCTIPVRILKGDSSDDDQSNSVCSTISLSFTQSMVMTRQAFRGTLTVYNGSSEGAMENVRLNLEVKNKATGAIATSHEMQITAESLAGFQGELNLASGWTLDARETGVAKVLFIPTKYAAPEAPEEYSFGGTLSYTDPATGLDVVRDLYPATLTVKPSPELDLTYFMQRNVRGDDPLTEAVEPCEEAEFSLLIHNKGRGEATNIRMNTDQPRIVENAKGLNVDFELTGSQLNGQEKTLALGQSVATEFGNIPAGGSAYAQWWIRSSLLGHFTEYDVKATHLSSYGNPDLSLLDKVTIHELIRSLEVEEGEGRGIAFLTNDLPDAEDTPDMLYLTSGRVLSVGAPIRKALRKTSATTYELDITPMAPGWTYGSVSDPTYGVPQLKSVVRKSDGKVMSLRNFWQTDCTLRDGKDPLYENRIHFADLMESEAMETYVFTFEPAPAVWLEVKDIEGAPDEAQLAIEPVPSLRVVFNKTVDPTTFTADDITLSVQGRKQDASLIGISTQDNRTFTLNFSRLNEVAGNGYYTLAVQSADVTDHEGFRGRAGKQVGWIMFKDGLVQLRKSVFPDLSGSVACAEAEAPSEAKRAKRMASREANNEDNAAYGATLRFTATPAPGYTFANWTLDGEVVGTEPVLEYMATGDINLRANFTRNSYYVSVEDCENGRVSVGSGFYGHGDEVTVVAVPDADYAFDHWTVDGRRIDGGAQLTLKVEGALSLKAHFAKEIFEQRMDIRRGWNWVSSFITEPLSVSGFAPVAHRIVAQFDEVINDPVFGLTGGIGDLRMGQGYKLESLYDHSLRFNGHVLQGDGYSLPLKKGWNWMGYPWRTESALATTLTHAEEGDYIVGQTGFAEFADGSWEGSLTSVRPGKGYLYRSASDKALLFSPLNAASRVKGVAMASPSAPSPAHAEVDIYAYPNTMNIVAELFDTDANTTVSSEDYLLYAYTETECRGVARASGPHYYLTVYGDRADALHFVVEDIRTGARYTVAEHLTFCNDVVGSRKNPQRFTFGMSDAVQSLDADTQYDVYNLQGFLVRSGVRGADMPRLPRGIYIVNGQKYSVK